MLTRLLSTLQEQLPLSTSAQATYPQCGGPAGWPSCLRASGPPGHHRCEGCTLPLTVSEAVKTIKQIKHLGRHEEPVQARLLGGFIGRTRSPFTRPLYTETLPPVPLLLRVSPLTITPWWDQLKRHTLPSNVSQIATCWEVNLAFVVSQNYLQTARHGQARAHTEELCDSHSRPGCRDYRALNTSVCSAGFIRRLHTKNSKLISSLRLLEHLILWRWTITHSRGCYGGKHASASDGKPHTHTLRRKRIPTDESWNVFHCRDHHSFTETAGIHLDQSPLDFYF